MVASKAGSKRGGGNGCADGGGCGDTSTPESEPVVPDAGAGGAGEGASVGEVTARAPHPRRAALFGLGGSGSIGATPPSPP